MKETVLAQTRSALSNQGQELGIDIEEHSPAAIVLNAFQGRVTNNQSEYEFVQSLINSIRPSEIV